MRSTILVVLCAVSMTACTSHRIKTDPRAEAKQIVLNEWSHWYLTRYLDEDAEQDLSTGELLGQCDEGQLFESDDENVELACEILDEGL
jgi:hypothetical protein